MLTKDGSAFDNMFALDDNATSNGSSKEGENDDSPIHLPGDTAGEFRALLWSLYALYVGLNHVESI